MDFNRFAKINLVPEDDRGISLVEVLMALTVLLVGILAYAKSSSASLDTNIQSAKESIAITLAQDKIEELKAISLTDGLGDTNTVNTEGVIDGPGTPYTRTWSVTENTFLPDTCNCYYDVVVTVSWVNQGNRSVTLNTQINQ